MWKPQPHRPIADWYSWSQCTARVAPRANVDAPSHRISSHPRIINLSIPSTAPTAWGRKQRSPGSISPRKVWKTHPHWLIIDWLGLMEPARGESCPSGQRRGRAAHGEDKVQSPDQKSFHISTTPTNYRNQDDGDHMGRTRPTRCGNPNSGYTFVDWWS